MTLTDLASAAAFERDLRERHYPAQVRDRKLPTEDAEADFAAWAAIAEWLSTPAARIEPDGAIPTAQVPGWIGLAEMERAAERAMRTQQEACANQPANSDLRRRRDDVVAILHALGRTRALFDGIKAALIAGLAKREGA